ncbi:MAG: single-stranded DNA-binding protein, partial [Rhizobiales bacterium]|nr:single-stranded DNA-binding protein [Hyphomicrobiales bacterium]
IGSITEGKGVIKLNIFSNFYYKGENDCRINTVSIFNENRIKYIKKHVGVGDLVSAEGNIEQNSYENKDGETIYTTNLMVRDFNRIAKNNRRRHKISGRREPPNL